MILETSSTKTPKCAKMQQHPNIKNSPTINTGIASKICQVKFTLQTNSITNTIPRLISILKALTIMLERINACFGKYTLAIIDLFLRTILTDAFMHLLKLPQNASAININTLKLGSLCLNKNPKTNE